VAVGAGLANPEIVVESLTSPCPYSVSLLVMSPTLNVQSFQLTVSLASMLFERYSEWIFGNVPMPWDWKTA